MLKTKKNSESQFFIQPENPYFGHLLALFGLKTSKQDPPSPKEKKMFSSELHGLKKVK